MIKSFKENETKKKLKLQFAKKTLWPLKTFDFLKHEKHETKFKAKGKT